MAKINIENVNIHVYCKRGGFGTQVSPELPEKTEVEKIISDLPINFPPETLNTLIDAAFSVAWKTAYGAEKEPLEWRVVGTRMEGIKDGVKTSYKLSLAYNPDTNLPYSWKEGYGDATSAENIAKAHNAYLPTLDELRFLFRDGNALAKNRSGRHFCMNQTGNWVTYIPQTNDVVPEDGTNASRMIVKREYYPQPWAMKPDPSDTRNMDEKVKWYKVPELFVELSTNKAYFLEYSTILNKDSYINLDECVEILNQLSDTSLTLLTDWEFKHLVDSKCKVPVGFQFGYCSHFLLSGNKITSWHKGKDKIVQGKDIACGNVRLAKRTYLESDIIAKP